MTPDRKKSITILALTFIAGLLIGAFSISLWARQHYKAGGKGRWEQHDRRIGFKKKLLQVLKVDSAVAGIIEPIIDKSLNRFDSLQTETDSRFRVIMEQLKSDLRPHLTQEQMNHLQKFSPGRQGKGREHHRHNKDR